MFKSVSVVAFFSVFLATTIGCQVVSPGFDRTSVHTELSSADSTSAQSPSSLVVEAQNEFKVSGLVAQPGRYRFHASAVSLGKLIDAAGGLERTSQQPLLISIRRLDEGASAMHYLPSEALNHSTVSEWTVTTRDEVCVIGLRQSSLGTPGVDGRTLKVVRSEDNLTGVAGIEVDGRPQQIPGPSPSLVSLDASVSGDLVLQRWSRELGRHERYHLTKEFLSHNAAVCYLHDGDQILSKVVFEAASFPSN